LSIFWLAKIGESVKIKRIAITGVLGSGKSTVAKIFEESGAYRIDADEVAHRLLDQNSQLRQQIAHEFGQEIFSGNNVREKLAKLVFSNPEKLKRLEELIHPKILQNLLREMKQAESSHTLCIAEVPLLFEVQWESHFDVTLCVTSDPLTCLKRSGKSQEEYEKRMARQLSQEEKVKRADYIVENNKNIQTLEANIAKLGIQ